MRNTERRSLGVTVFPNRPESLERLSKTEQEILQMVHKIARGAHLWVRQCTVLVLRLSTQYRNESLPVGRKQLRTVYCTLQQRAECADKKNSGAFSERQIGRQKTT